MNHIETSEDTLEAAKANFKAAMVEAGIEPLKELPKVEVIASEINDEVVEHEAVEHEAVGALPDEVVYDISKKIRDVVENPTEIRNQGKMQAPNSGKKFVEEIYDGQGHHTTKTTTKGDGWESVEITGDMGGGMDMGDIGPMMAGMIHKSMQNGLHAKRGAMG